MRVLGLDPGSRKTGWGVVERRARELHCVAAGHVAPPARLSLAERLLQIVREVAGVMERYAPDCVVIEAAFHHSYARSTLVLGHVRGALMVAAVQRGLPITEYAPRAIKLAVVGSGAAEKFQVAHMVRALLALRERPGADAADALAVAVCHAHARRLGLLVPATAPPARQAWR